MDDQRGRILFFLFVALFGLIIIGIVGFYFLIWPLYNEANTGLLVPVQTPGSGGSSGNQSTPSTGNTNVDFSGTWSSTYGDIILTQTGDQVTGHYPWRSTIDGTVSGNELTFVWTESDGASHGTGYFIMNPSGRSFSGAWRYDDSNRQWDGSWSATKKN